MVITVSHKSTFRPYAANVLSVTIFIFFICAVFAVSLTDVINYVFAFICDKKHFKYPGSVIYCVVTGTDIICRCILRSTSSHGWRVFWWLLHATGTAAL